MMLMLPNSCQCHGKGTLLFSQLWDKIRKVLTSVDVSLVLTKRVQKTTLKCIWYRWACVRWMLLLINATNIRDPFWLTIDPCFKYGQQSVQLVRSNPSLVLVFLTSIIAVYLCVTEQIHSCKVLHIFRFLVAWVQVLDSPWYRHCGLSESSSSCIAVTVETTFLHKIGSYSINSEPCNMKFWVISLLLSAYISMRHWKESFLYLPVCMICTSVKLSR